MRNLELVTAEHQDIDEQYKKDFTRCETEDKKPYLTEIYNLIPAELNRSNKRFKYSDIKKGLQFSRSEDNFIWLTNAGAAIPVYNVVEPSVPLLLNEKSSLFKLFLSDVGMLTSMYGKAAKIEIISGGRDINNGALYENVVAQELYAHGFKLYYYNSKKSGELDFVVEYNGRVLPIEVKSGKSYLRHSALSNVMRIPNYSMKEAFVFSEYNIKVEDDIVYYPIYMVMFLENDDIKLPVVEITPLSDML